MTIQSPISDLTETETEVFEDPSTLRFALRLMLDFYGPAGVIAYARDHGIRCAPCNACGWVPHVHGECLLCEVPPADWL